MSDNLASILFVIVLFLFIFFMEYGGEIIKRYHERELKRIEKGKLR